MTHLLGLAAGFALCLSSGVAAQCPGPSDIQFSRYGTTCQFFGQAATLAGRYDATTCSLTLDQSVARTCCNTFPAAQLLILGPRPIDPGMTHPALLPGCLLSVFPDILLVAPRPTGNGVTTWEFAVPPIGQVTLYAQGLDTYFTTIGLTVDFQTTQGLRMDFR